MTFTELERICIALYGSHWKQQIVSATGGGSEATIGNWKRQGVPKRIENMLPDIAKQRLIEIKEINDELQNKIK